MEITTENNKGDITEKLITMKGKINNLLLLLFFF